MVRSPQLTSVLTLLVACDANLQVKTKDVSKLSGEFEIRTVAQSDPNKFIVSGACAPGVTKVVVTAPIDVKASCVEGVFTVELILDELNDGLIAVNAEALDHTGAKVAEASTTLTKDAAIPSITITETFVNLANQSSAILSGTCSANARMIDITGDLTASVPCEQGQWSKTFDASTLPDGAITLEGRARNSAGVPSLPVTRTITKKTTRPTVTIQATTIVAGNVGTALLTGSCSENQRQIVIGGAVQAQTLCDGSMWTTTSDFTSAPDGNVSVTADLTDSFDNAAIQASAVMMKDTLSPAPITAVTVAAVISQPIDIQWSGGADAHFSHVNAKACAQNDCSTGCTGVTTATASPVSLSGLTDGATYYACVQAQDSLGNTSAFTPSTAFLIDTTAPTAPSVTNPSAYINVSSVGMAFTGGSDANFSHYEVKACATNACASSCTAAVTGPTSPITVTGLMGGGSYHLCARTVDLAGNASLFAASAGTLTVDMTLPAAPTVTAPAAYANATSINAAWTGGSDDHMVNGFSAKACTNSGCSIGCTSVVNAASSPAALAGLVNGSSYYLCVRSEDAAGNASAYASSSSAVMIDTSAPAAVTPGNPASYSTSTTVTFSWTGGSDANFDHFSVKACTNNDCATGCTTPASAASSPQSVGPVTNGSPYYACVQAVDAAGNSSAFGVSTTPVKVNTVSLTPISDRLVATLNAIGTQEVTTIDLDNADAGNDANMNYTCYFDQTVDGSVAAVTPCTSLDGLATLNASTGLFTWNPSTFASGTYEILVTGTYSVTGASATEIFVLEVENYLHADLRLDVNAAFGTGSGFPTNPTATWQDLTINNFDGAITGTAATSGWAGDGTLANPHRLNLTGNGEITFPAALAGQSQYAVMGWFRPNWGEPVGGETFFDLGDGTGAGLVVKDSDMSLGYLELVPSRNHRDTTLALAPKAYWRLQESSGTSAADASGFAHTGTYAGSPTLYQASPLTYETARSVLFDGVDDEVSIPDHTDFTGTSGYTIAFWTRITQAPTTRYNFIGQWGVGGAPNAAWRMIYGTDAKVTVEHHDGSMNASLKSATSLNLNTWYHVVAVYDGGSSGTNARIYLNGILDAAGTITAVPQNSAYALKIGASADMGLDNRFKGHLSNVAYWNTNLSTTDAAKLYASSLGCRAQAQIVTGAWNHIGVTSDGSAATLHWNGRAECGFTPHASALTAGSASLRVGATHAATDRLASEVADFRVYTTSLASNVTESWRNGFRRFFDVSGVVQTNLQLYLDGTFHRGNSTFTSGSNVWLDLLNRTLNHGVLFNFAAFPWNSSPNRLIFDGTDDYVHVASQTTLKPTSSVSVMGWIRLTTLPSVRVSPNANATVLSKGPAGGALQDYSLKINATNRVEGAFHDGTGLISASGATALSANTWHHVAFTYDGANIRTYLNGSLDGTSPITGAIRASDDSVFVGAQAPTSPSSRNHLLGQMAVVMMYDRALSGSEIAANCNAHKARYAGATCP